MNKNILTKLWIWGIVILIILIIASNSSTSSPTVSLNTSNSNNLNTSIISNEVTNSIELVEDNVIYLDNYPKFIEECFEKVSSRYSFLSDAYSISTNSGNFISIYFYSDKYYDLPTYSNNVKAFSNELLDEISKKQYKNKFLQPKNLLLQITYCGYAKDLYTKEISTNTQPLATLNVYTDDLKNKQNLFEYISNNINIYDYWFNN